MGQDEAQSVAVVTATPTEPAIETATIEASQPLVVAAPTAEQTTIQLLRSQIGTEQARAAGLEQQLFVKDQAIILLKLEKEQLRSMMHEGWKSALKNDSTADVVKHLMKERDSERERAERAEDEVQKAQVNENGSNFDEDNDGSSSTCSFINDRYICKSNRSDVYKFI